MVIVINIGAVCLTAVGDGNQIIRGVIGVDDLFTGGVGDVQYPAVGGAVKGDSFAGGVGDAFGGVRNGVAIGVYDLFDAKCLIQMIDVTRSRG